MAKLTLDQLAAELGFSDKTTRKYVRLYKIPHGGFGQDMRFDLAEVWEHLKTVHAGSATDKVQLKPAQLNKPARPRKSSFSEFYKDLGLEPGH